MSREADSSLSLLDHLEELRWRLFKAVLAIALGVVAGWFISPWVLDQLALPIVRAQEAFEAEKPQIFLELEVTEDLYLRLRNPEALSVPEDEVRGVAFFQPGAGQPFRQYGDQPSAPLIYLKPTDPFMLRIKMSLLVGVVLAIPVILWQIWAFVAPGLLRKEKALALPLLVAASVLFPVGALFAYALMDITFQFLFRFIIADAASLNDARAYFTFAVSMLLAFGLVFELPIAILLATRLGLVTVPWLARHRGHVFVVLLFVAAIITPSGDPVTLMALALPLQFLFEAALVASRLIDWVAAPVEDSAGNDGVEPET